MAKPPTHCTAQATHIRNNNTRGANTIQTPARYTQNRSFIPLLWLHEDSTTHHTMAARQCTAPPAGVTKAAYDVFRTAAQTVLKKVELEGKHTPSEIRLLRHTLNDLTTSVFLQVRASLLVPGVEEPLDPSLTSQLALVEREYKQSRVDLQQAMDGVETLIQSQIRGPMSDIDLTASIPTPALPRLPTSQQLDRIDQTDRHIQESIKQLTTNLPAVLETASTQAEYLASSNAASRPLSEEVRGILTKVNKDLSKGKKTRKSLTAAAAAAAPTEEGEGGKARRSSSTRLSARIAAKPY